MTDHDAMLAAVIAAPGDDTVRLAYADWIEEHGGQPERAEFVRVQVELAGMEEERMAFEIASATGLFLKVPCDDMFRHMAETIRWKGEPISDEQLARCARFCYLRRRERELFVPDAHWWDFTPWNGMAVGSRLEDWRRGFVWKVECNWPSWVQHAAAIRAALPVERVRLTTRPDVVRYAIDRPWERVTDFIVDNGTAVASHRVSHLDLHNARSAIDHQRMAIAKATDQLLRHCWPGIAFELPPENFYVGLANANEHVNMGFNHGRIWVDGVEITPST
jgi:uncharacterized protein (TIGR02996 family)